MDCTRGGFYAMGVVQIAAVGLVIILNPPVSVQVFSYVPCVTNGTLTHACGDTRSVKLMLALPSLAVSAAAAAFTQNTFSLRESGVITEETAFGPEALGQTGLWNALFWFVVSGAHAIAIAAACSPVDLFAWALATYLCVSFLSSICSPQECGPDGPLPGSVTLANANILGYMSGVGVALYNVPGQYSNRLVLLFVMVVLDYFMGIGHVWERTPHFDTVANSRLFWVCNAGLGLAILYAVWKEDLLTPPVPSTGGD